MNRQTSVSCVRKHAPRLRPLLGAASWLWLAASPLLRASESVVEIGPAVARSRVPRWDARGLGPLPWQGIACIDVSEDGRFLAVGTIAPPGDPNLFVLDENGKIVGQHRAGCRWINEVTISSDGRFVVGSVPSPGRSEIARVGVGCDSIA